MKDPNTRRAPRNSTPAFRAGWKACETGKSLTDNPHWKLNAPGGDEWNAGFQARGEIGFETAHLPRKPFSDAFAF